MKITPEFRRKLFDIWSKRLDYPLEVLDFCLKEVKGRITYEGLGGETCVGADRDEHVRCAGQVGFFFGRAHTIFAFLDNLEMLALGGRVDW